jgi:hypothetical protein
MGDEDPRDQAGPSASQEPSADQAPDHPISAAGGLEPDPAGAESATPEDPGAETMVVRPRRDPGAETVALGPDRAETEAEAGASAAVPDDPGAETVALRAGAETVALRKEADPGAETMVVRPRADPGAETAVVRGEAGPSGTSVMPAVSPTTPAPPRWSARAQVRPHEQDEDWEEMEWQEPEPPRRSLLAPMLVALVALVLLAILAYGIALIVGKSDDTTTPLPSGSASVATSTAASSRPANPTTPAPTATKTTAASTVAIPRVNDADLDFNGAAARLVALGLQVVREDRASTSVPAGRVIDTNPRADSVVPVGSTVTVIVSTGAPKTTPATTSVTTPATKTSGPPDGVDVAVP